MSKLPLTMEEIVIAANHRQAALIFELESKLEKAKEALKNIIEYLHETDELGEEWLTPQANKHYKAAREVLKDLESAS